MPFAKECLSFEGKRISATPFWAYGWSCKPERAYGYQPKPFALRIHKFLIWKDTVAVLQGTVDETNHDYNGFWVMAVPRIDDDIDFDEKPGPCGLVISVEMSKFDASLVPPNHPNAIQAGGDQILRGHATLKVLLPSAAGFRK